MSAASPIHSEALPRAIWSSTALMVLGRLWSAAAGLACLALLTRADLPWAPLQGAEFGRLTYYLALYVVLDCLADFGTSSASIQLGAADPGVLHGAIRAGRKIRAAAALTGWILVTLAASLAGEAGLGWIALASLAPLSRAAELSSAIYQSQIRWRVPVLVRALVATARLGAFATLAQAGCPTFGPYLASFALLGALGNVALYLIARAALAHSRQDAIQIPWQALFVGALPLAMVAIAQQAYFYADNLLLRAMVDPVDLGHYNAAVKILGLLIMVSVFTTTSALPWLARRSQEGQLGAASARLMQAVFPAACLLLGFLWPLAPGILTGLFGAEFEAAGDVLRWFLLVAAMIYLGAPLLTALVAAGRSGAVLFIVLSGLALNLSMNALLIPGLGSSGAAVATLGTEFWVALAAFMALRRAGQNPFPRPLFLALGPVLFAGAALLSSSLAH